MEHILTHSAENPRNSEGSFIELADGRLFFAYSRYCGDDSGDHAAADIAAVTSADGGKSWSRPQIIFRHRQMNLMSVSLLRLQDSRIAMVYLEKSAIPGMEKYIDCRPKIVFSSDEAGSWSAPVEIAGIPPAYLVVNNDRLVQLSSGRLILPASDHQYTDRGLGAGIIRFFLSDDGGMSWRLSKDFIYPPSASFRNGLMEPGVVELEDKSLFCFIRTAVGCHYKAVSYDHGESWSAAVPAPEFPAPESPLSIKRNPQNGKLYAVWNDYSPERCVQSTSPCSWHRTPLVMAESSDEGRSWQAHRILESAPDHGYCYTAMYFKGGELFLAYCCGGEPECTDPLQETKLRSVKLG